MFAHSRGARLSGATASPVLPRRFLLWFETSAPVVHKWNIGRFFFLVILRVFMCLKTSWHFPWPQKSIEEYPPFAEGLDHLELQPGRCPAPGRGAHKSVWAFWNGFRSLASLSIVPSRMIASRTYEEAGKWTRLWVWAGRLFWPGSDASGLASQSERCLGNLPPTGASSRYAGIIRNVSETSMRLET